MNGNVSTHTTVSSMAITYTIALLSYVYTFSIAH